MAQEIRNHEFLRKLYPLMRDYEGQLPNLRDIFRPEAVEWLLMESIRQKVCNGLDPKPLIRFVMNTGYKDEPKVDQNGEIILHRTTPIHLATKKDCPEVLEDLFRIYEKFDVNYTDDDCNDVTHFHAACEYGLYHIVEKFLESGQDPNCVWREMGDSTPLILALMRNKKEVAELLLRHGADPNLANGEGSTPLHIICQKCQDSDELAKMFFEVNKKFNREVQLEVRDYLGNTPLLSALKCGNKKLAESLLSRGASPTVVNAKGLTPLHIICDRYDDAEGLAEFFFKANEKINRTVEINAKDKLGNAPLHLALRTGNKYNLVKCLLRRGAVSNLANAVGLTPLHIICDRIDDADGLAEFFFKINEKNNRKVEIHAKDKFDCTPLQLAVLNLAPKTLDVLLKYGADLSSFVFPSESYFAEDLVPSSIISLCGRHMHRLMVGSRALNMVDMLENRGYKLNRDDALEIMGLFTKYRSLYQPMNLDTSWYDDEEFANTAKEIMMKPNLSLYDLVKWPEEAEKNLIYLDYSHCSSCDWFRLSEKLRQVCTAHLCEAMSRGFFRRWALDSFSELTRLNRLPIEYDRELITNGTYTNKDLHDICLLAAGLSS